MGILSTAESIALELSSRVAEITIANGYNTDIGLRNYRGRLKIDEDDIPCCVVVEGADTIGKSSGLKNIQVFQEYVLGGYAFCDPDNPNDTAHKIIKDLKRAVFSDGTTWGGKVRSIEYKGRNIGPRSDGVSVVFAVIHIHIEYAEDLSNP